MLNYKKEYLKYKKKYLELLKGGFPGAQAAKYEEPDFIPDQLSFKIKDIVMFNDKHYIITDMNVRTNKFGGDNYYSYIFELSGVDPKNGYTKALNNEVKIADEKISITQFKDNILKIIGEIDNKIEQERLRKEQIEIKKQENLKILRLRNEIKSLDKRLDVLASSRGKLEHDPETEEAIALDKIIAKFENDLLKKQSEFKLLYPSYDYEN